MLGSVAHETRTSHLVLPGCLRVGIGPARGFPPKNKHQWNLVSRGPFTRPNLPLFHFASLARAMGTKTIETQLDKGLTLN